MVSRRQLPAAGGRCSPAPSSTTTPEGVAPQRVGKHLLVDDLTGHDHQRLEDHPVPSSVTVVSVDGERAEHRDTHTSTVDLGHACVNVELPRRYQLRRRCDTARADNEGERRHPDATTPPEITMNKSHGLLAAAALSLTLTACSVGGSKAPAEISKPGPDLTQHSQPAHQFHREPICRQAPARGETDQTAIRARTPSARSRSRKKHPVRWPPATVRVGEPRRATSPLTRADAS